MSADQLDKVDEFEEFDNEEFEEHHLQPPQSFGARMATMWHENPGFKMLVILGVGAVVLGGAYLFMNSSSKTATAEATPSRVSGVASNVKGTPGADVTPEYKKILEESNKKTAEEALKTGGSAIATPVGNIADSTPEKKEQPVDPLALWRQPEVKPVPQPTPAPTPATLQPAPAPAPVDNTQQVQQQTQLQTQQASDIQQMSEAMKTQIGALTQAWGPTPATVIVFPTKGTTTTSTSTSSASTSGANGQIITNNNTTTTSTTPTAPTTTTPTAPVQKLAKVILPAGEINYGLMITEANSDVPGPILAQILSGPLKGGRVIGAFTATDEYLVLKFTLLSIGGHTYTIDAIALDPNTTLGAVATETDQRYFARVVLPAAAAFISQFGQAISTAPSTTTQSASSTVTTTQPSSTTQALYSGAGQAAQQVSNFVNQAGNQVKPLVRVASNTAIGIFFTKPVTDQQQGVNP
jgi:intracellular multiplication protein IcmE